MGCGQKLFKLMWLCLPNGHLSRVSHQSTNDKDENEMILEIEHNSPGIYLAVEENLGNSLETI